MSELAGVETPPAGAPPAAGEAPDKGEGLAFGEGNAVAFEDLMDTLVSEEEQAGAEPGAAATGGAVDATGQPVAAPEGTPAAGAATPPPTAGDAGQPGAAPAADAAATGQAADPAAVPAGGVLPDGWTADVKDLKLDDLSTAYSEVIAEQYQTKAYDEVKAKHPKYFEALGKHPRLLVGERVPDLRPGKGPDDFEVLKDSADAESWQEMLKSILLEEVRDVATKSVEADQDRINATHASIELFQKNPDLVPTTKGFDRELADSLMLVTKPYELRNEAGKLIGFTIPVQPLIDNLRETLKAKRAAAGAPPAAAPAAAGAPAAAPAAGAPPVEPPQSGIPAKAGTSAEDNSEIADLFGTLGEEWRSIRL